ncbi:hypothetical protein AB0H73_14605 [Streptomyces olivoreticuli]
MPIATSAAEQWLIEADDDPDHARLWLRQANILFLQVGRKWGAVQTSATAGQEAVNAGVQGPTVGNEGKYYFLVSTDAVATWQPIQGATCLGNDHWMTVPHPVITSPPGPYWVIPPDGSGQLVDLTALHAALVEAASAL